MVYQDNQKNRENAEFSYTTYLSAPILLIWSNISSKIIVESAFQHILSIWPPLFTFFEKEDFQKLAEYLKFATLYRCHSHIFILWVSKMFSPCMNRKPDPKF